MARLGGILGNGVNRRVLFIALLFAVDIAKGRSPEGLMVRFWEPPIGTGAVAPGLGLKRAAVADNVEWLVAP